MLYCFNSSVESLRELAKRVLMAKLTKYRCSKNHIETLSLYLKVYVNKVSRLNKSSY